MPGRGSMAPSGGITQGRCGVLGASASSSVAQAASASTTSGASVGQCRRMRLWCSGNGMLDFRFEKCARLDGRPQGERGVAGQTRPDAMEGGECRGGLLRRRVCGEPVGTRNKPGGCRCVLPAETLGAVGVSRLIDDGKARPGKPAQGRDRHPPAPGLSLPCRQEAQLESGDGVKELRLAERANHRKTGARLRPGSIGQQPPQVPAPPPCTLAPAQPRWSARAR